MTDHADLIALLQAVPVPLLALDAEARIMGVNRPARTLLGEDLEGRPFITVLRHPAIVSAVESVLASNPPEPIKISVQISARGRDLSSDVTISSLLLNGLDGVLVTIEDASGIEHAEQMRSDFIANVSHELRTPLTALIGFIETLRGPARDDPVARTRFLDIMFQEAGRMNRLVSDLLSLSRVESEERRRPSCDVDLAALIRQTAASLAPQAKQANVVIRTHGANAPHLMTGDQDQLVQVLTNLIENAVKYGGADRQVDLTLRVIPRDPVLRGAAIAIEVADQGDGIEQRHLPRLTERFYRVDSHRSREQGGTGLGLAITKHIISRHRGRLRIESQKGVGSRFTVILPQRQNRG